MPAEAAPSMRKPAWLKVRFPGGERYQALKSLMRDERLNTVCEDARCPNIGECWNAGTATFMILGDVCTRSCGFCAVTTGRPGAIDPLEPYRLARAVAALGLDYVVITSVNRDDVEHGGAEVFAACIKAIRRHDPAINVEVLIPDFKGDWAALATVVEARPFVLNHNIETVPRLYRVVRPQARYERSLELIRRAKDAEPAMLTKSGFMVGLGETQEELFGVMRDLRAHGCDLVTIGQYLRPSPQHLPIARYYDPAEYEAFRAYGRELGFTHVEAGPLVRSSYHAERQAGQRGATQLIALEEVARG
ncbi:MAG TPA: lipoyl synthase [Dehalococcoidia bacterium]|nr:lipoyl synthase [Dehalococcoidia bacterium]